MEGRSGTWATARPEPKGEGMVRRIVFSIALFGAVMMAAPATAQTETIIIEIDGITRGAEGSITTIAEVAVDPAMVGATCAGASQTTNNASEHPNNDFILSSGTSTAVIADWEREAGVVVNTSMTLVLGETITVQLRLGTGEVSSGMVSIALTCAQPPPITTTTTTTTSTTTTTTTLPPPPSTTTTTTTLPPPPATTTTTTTLPPPPATTTTTTTTTTPAPTTTTTEPPPEGGVSAGGGSMAPASGEAAAWLGGSALAAAAGTLLLALGWRQGWRFY